MTQVGRRHPTLCGVPDKINIFTLNVTSLGRRYMWLLLLRAKSSNNVPGTSSKC
jgi:hypothetical protein